MLFSETTKQEARLRQNSKCGVCGDELDSIAEFAHHIYPHSLGGDDIVDNCVIVCDPCHYIVHNHGQFRSGIVAPKEYFEYFYGSRSLY